MAMEDLFPLFGMGGGQSDYSAIGSMLMQPQGFAALAAQQGLAPEDLQLPAMARPVEHQLAPLEGTGFVGGTPNPLTALEGSEPMMRPAGAPPLGAPTGGAPNISSAFNPGAWPLERGSSAMPPGIRPSGPALGAPGPAQSGRPGGAPVGDPMDIRSDAQRSAEQGGPLGAPTQRRSGMDFLRGVQAVQPPKPQTISSPSAPRPVPMRGGSELAALLMQLTGTAGQGPSPYYLASALKGR